MQADALTKVRWEPLFAQTSPLRGHGLVENRHWMEIYKSIKVAENAGIMLGIR
jgi:hypothetical protein